MNTKNIITNALSNKINLIIPLCITTLFSTLFLALAPVFLGNLIGSVINNTNFTLWCILTCLCIPLRLLCEYIKTNQVFALGNYISTFLQKEAYKVSMKAEVNDISKFKYDDLANRISNDCVKIGNEYIAKNVVNFITNIVYLSIIFIVIMCIAPILGLIIIGGVPVYYFCVVGVKKFYKSSTNDLNRVSEEGNKVVAENFQKIIDIKVKNGVNKEIDDYNSWFETNTKKHHFNWILNMFNNGYVYDFVVSIVSIIVIAVGLSLANNGNSMNVSVGNVVTCVVYIPTIFTNIYHLMNNSIRTSLIQDEIKRLDDIFDFRSEQKSEPITSLDDLFSIRFTDVCYNDDNGIVKELSFDIKNNEKIGILCLDDHTGNVIFDLLTKIKKPRSGKISINNCELNKINTFYLRDLVTAVSNDSDLFNDSILNNITYPLPFDEYKYNDSLYKAKLKDTIFDLEAKDNTNVEELDDDVRQQIILANAFYKDSKVFVFNNATNKLNVKLEEEIIKEIYKLKNKFIIMISDRGYNLLNCDKIIVVQDGVVLETGSVTDLSKNKESLFFKSIRKIKLSKTKAS